MSAPELVPGSDSWLSVMTASKVPAVMGLSAWDSPLSLWLKMRGETPHDSAASEAMEWGTFVEPYIVNYFWNKRHPDWAMQAGETTWTRDDLPWAAANTDSHGVDADGNLVIVEAKSVFMYESLDHWGDEGTDQIPAAYEAQVQWQMHMTHGFGGAGITRAYVERQGPLPNKRAVFVVEYDPAWATRIEGACAAFMLSLDNPDALPPTDDSVATYEALRQRNPDIERQAEWEINPELAAAYLTAHEAHAAATAELSLRKSEILRVAGTAQYVMCGGVKVARRQAGRGAPSLRHVGASVSDLVATVAELPATA